MLHEVRVKYSFALSDNFREKQTRHIKKFLDYIISHYTDTWLQSPPPPFSIKAPPLCVLLKKPQVLNKEMHFPKFLELLNFEKILFSTDYYVWGLCISLWEVLHSGEVTGMKSSCNPSRPVHQSCQVERNASGKSRHGRSWEFMARRELLWEERSRAGEQEYQSIKSA